LIAARPAWPARSSSSGVVSEVDMAMPETGSFAIEEHELGGTVWVAIRARGSDWSWFTRDEAARVGRNLLEKYGSDQPYQYPMLAAE
jgi:hypothetical protein